MSDFLDAEFYALTGDFSRMRELSDYKLAKLFQKGRGDLCNAKSDRRLKQTTREARMQAATRLIGAWEAEYVRRANAKELSLFLAKISKKGNIYQFPGRQE